jgi:hypothetical protein
VALLEHATVLIGKDPGELYLKYGEENERITLRWMLRRWIVRIEGGNSTEYVATANFDTTCVESKGSVTTLLVREIPSGRKEPVTEI